VSQVPRLRNSACIRREHPLFDRHHGGRGTVAREALSFRMGRVTGAHGSPGPDSGEGRSIFAVTHHGPPFVETRVFTDVRTGHRSSRVTRARDRSIPQWAAFSGAQGRPTELLPYRCQDGPDLLGSPDR
jgi:hypothetical protein